MKDEIMFAQFVLRFRAIGFGRMMQIISHIWWNEDHIGALKVGSCFGKRKIAIEVIRADLKQLGVEVTE